VTRKSLGEEKVAGCPIYVRDCGVAEGVERVEPVEHGFYLPCPEGHLHPAFGDAAQRLVTDEGGGGFERFVAGGLIGPEAPELRYQAVR